jgi:hypothetical protein
MTRIKAQVEASAVLEARAMRQLLCKLMASGELLEGEYSSEAASIGAILGRFCAGTKEIR